MKKSIEKQQQKIKTNLRRRKNEEKKWGKSDEYV